MKIKNYRQFFRTLKGGGPDDSSIFSLGIENAKMHGINVVADTPNRANGDCLFEAVIDNINHRQCFPDKLIRPVQEYREDWSADLMGLYHDTAHYPGDQQLDDWIAAWDKQMNPGEYNVDEYSVSDLVPAGLGHCVSKDILVFNVSSNSTYPVDFYPANIFNKEPTTLIPLLLVYNGNHYESLLPVNQRDIDRSVQLVNSLKSQTYNEGNPTGYLPLALQDQKVHEAAMETESLF